MAKNKKEWTNSEYSAGPVHWVSAEFTQISADFGAEIRFFFPGEFGRNRPILLEFFQIPPFQNLSKISRI